MALDYHEQHPNNQIYANFHIYSGNYPISKKPLKNFNFIPYLFLPISQLSNCMIIADDYSNISDNIDTLIKIIANMSRKTDVEVLLSGQDYTMINPKLRRMSEYIIYPRLSIDISVHRLDFYKENEKLLRIFQHRKYKVGIIKRVGKYYNTNEIVPFGTERKLLLEIKKYSKNIDDLEINLECFTRNARKRKKFFNDLSSELGFI